jgi:hypothetical protein
MFLRVQQQAAHIVAVTLKVQQQQEQPGLMRCCHTNQPPHTHTHLQATECGGPSSPPHPSHGPHTPTPFQPTTTYTVSTAQDPPPPYTPPPRMHSKQAPHSDTVTHTHLQLGNFVPSARVQQPNVVVRRSDTHHRARLIRSKRIYAAYRRLHCRCCCCCCSRRCCSCCPVPVLLLCCPSCAARCAAAFAGVGHQQVRLESLHVIHDDLPM